MERKRPKKLPTDPFDEFDRMFEEISQMMSDMMRDMGNSNSLDEPVQFSYTTIATPGSARRERRPREHPKALEGPGSEMLEEPEPLVDIWDNVKKVTVLVELPGVTKEDIDIEVEGKYLTLSVDTESKSFRKQVALPCSVKASSATANYRNGVLEVCLDKPAPRKKRRPKVEVL